MSKNEALPAIASVLHIRQSGLRSINVEMDLGNQSIVTGYVLTTQARACLRRILSRFEDNTPGRSWTLTGPYGSGKSYFSLFLMNLMGAAQPAHPYVLGSLQKVDPLLAQQVVNTLDHGNTKGLLPVPITGYRATLQDCIKHGLLLSLERLNRDGQIKPLLTELIGWTPETESRTVTHWLQRFIKIITQPEYGYLGMMLVFDEMGKPLEYSASHSETSDVYLLQELAEYASRSGDQPFIFVGILHQAFDRYALHLDRSAQREWSKVQGRFEDIAFQEPPSQQIRLLAGAIEYDHPHLLDGVLAKMETSAKDAVTKKWVPTLMKDEEFIEICERIYPFHPTAIVALPFLFQRLAQNERSIFAYLASFEPAGFQEFIQKNPVGRFIRLPDLFDYLSANFQGRLFASIRARAITETIEKLNSTPNLGGLEAQLLKTIGILNWLAEISHLRADEISIISALASDEVSETEIRQTLKRMILRSLIVFRRFNSTYSIWQGSDVDIEERLQKAQQQLTGAFSFADALQEHMPPRPIVARRHSYLTGTLRYFEVRYLDAITRDQVDLNISPGASGIVLLCLPLNLSEVEEFSQWAEQSVFQERADIIIGIAARTGRVTELLYELRCLDWVEKNTPELRDDSVARRELRARFAELRSLIQNSLDRSLNLHRLRSSKDCRWFHTGREITRLGNQGLSHLLSDICDKLYSQSPIIWNEIVNRRVLSSQGAAARRNLIEAMLTQAEKEYLNIDGYPPERSMYESLLKQSGIHRQQDTGAWGFTLPFEDDALRMKPAWEVMTEFVFKDPPGPKRLEDLYRILTAPPYGITEGVLPILLCAFVMVYQNEVTLYREGTLLPEAGVADWEVLLRRSELFSLAGCRVTGLRAAILERMGRGLRVPPFVMPVTRAIIMRLKALPEYAWRTRNLPEGALALRRAVEAARSPERFLFQEVPEALGLAAFVEDDFDSERFELFFERLNAALEALANATPRLIAWARDTWLAACNLPAGDEGWEIFRKQAEKLARRVTHPLLLPLLKRAAEAVDAHAALESTLAFVANRPPRSWSDADVERFEAQAQYLGRLLREESDDEELASLSPDVQARSQQIAEELLAFLTGLEKDPLILRAAIRRLLDCLQ